MKLLIFVGREVFLTPCKHSPMELIPIATDILKMAAAGLVVFYSGWYVVRSFLEQRFKIQMLEQKREHVKLSLPLRLQAYERITLFIERLDPSQLLVRLQSNGMAASELQALVLSEIRAEYQHNITQQLYVSEPAWLLVKSLRDETISMINHAMKALPADAAAIDLSRLILKHMAELGEENPYGNALRLIRSEMQNLM